MGNNVSSGLHTGLFELLQILCKKIKQKKTKKMMN